MGQGKRTVTPPFLKRLRDKELKDRSNENRLHKFASWLYNWHVTRIMAALSSLSILLFVFSQYKQLDIWTEESNARKEERAGRAWQILTTVAPGNSGKKWALEYLANVAHEKLSGVNISRNLHGSRVYLGNVSLMFATIKDASFEGVIADNSDFSHSNCESSDFSASELNNAKFEGANLGHASFSDANMLDAILSEADLENADFSAANISGARLDNANLVNINLKGTKASNVDFSNATVWDISVDEETDITGSDLSTIVFPHYVYASYGGQSDPSEPTPLEEAMKLCDILKKLHGSDTAKLPRKLVPGYECKI